MKEHKGKLVMVGKAFQVNVLTKKGSANLQIPQAAAQFNPADATDGLEVDVVRDESNRIIKVTIPGKSVVQPKIDSPKRGPHGKRGGSQEFGKNSATVARRKLLKASPKSLGMPFHNPYTFIPFGDGGRRDVPVARTVDEVETHHRLTGVLRLRVRTITPMLTCDPEPINGDGDHKTYQALCIGNDVILPSTGIRGALRSMMSILTGGTLGYLSNDSYLCQARDARLGPRSKNSPPNTPLNCFLARVVRSGNANQDGVLELGLTKLVSVGELARVLPQLDKERPSLGKPQRRLWIEMSGDSPKSVYQNNPPASAWELKLSGRPVNSKGKREGLFLGDGRQVVIPSEMWVAYNERNKHGDHPDLQENDLVWLEPTDIEATRIQSPDEVASLQWARWGREGTRLGDLVRQKHSQVIPDSQRNDGKVDEVTNLFGQVPVAHEVGELPDDQKPIAFAGRIFPENLVFPNAKSKVIRETLAPLAPPHPGCVAFYRQNLDPDQISTSDGLRGYKVYRTCNVVAGKEPWKYVTQPVFGEGGEPLRSAQKVNKTCDLIPENSVGILSIAFQGLSKRELGLLLHICGLPWRLGGGKPLSLGLCQPEIIQCVDESGKLVEPGQYASDRFNEQRVALWTGTQSPVNYLAYPRAVTETRHRKSRGGHVWFARHAKPRMNPSATTGNGVQPGLMPLYIAGKLLDQVNAAQGATDDHEPMVSGQVLPLFDSDDPEGDLLFGYDAFDAKVVKERGPHRRVVHRLEPFDPAKHNTGQ